MSEFISNIIDNSGRYDILERDHSHILIAQKPSLVENPFRMDILLHNFKRNIQGYARLVEERVRQNGDYLSNVFYKDDQNFHVRLGARANFKGDNRSLKHYPEEDQNRMLHLRGLEKEVLFSQKSDILAYYQPETARLQESLRGYRMRDVELDYSHREDQRDRESIDFKIAEEIFQIPSDGRLKFKRKRPYPVWTIHPREEPA